MAIQFLALEADRLWRFLDLTGTAPDALRARLAEPAFLAGVLDHLLADSGDPGAVEGRAEAAEVLDVFEHGGILGGRSRAVKRSGRSLAPPGGPPSRYSRRCHVATR